jgi:hypothetical protein
MIVSRQSRHSSTREAMPTAIGDLDVTYATDAVLGRDNKQGFSVLFVHRELTANTYCLWLG